MSNVLLTFTVVNIVNEHNVSESLKSRDVIIFHNIQVCTKTVKVETCSMLRKKTNSPLQCLILVVKNQAWCITFILCWWEFQSAKLHWNVISLFEILDFYGVVNRIVWSQFFLQTVEEPCGFRIDTVLTKTHFRLGQQLTALA